jgi:hypothetical protein
MSSVDGCFLRRQEPCWTLSCVWAFIFMVMLNCIAEPCSWRRPLSLPAAYDAHYLALAERVGAEFWTTDRRLANKVREALPWVHLLA